MARSFNLTAEINLRAPSNLKTVVAEIRRELGTVAANVNIKLDSKSAKSIDTVKNRLEAMNSVLISAKTNADSLNSSLQNLSNSLSSVSSAGSKTSGSISTTSTSAKQAAQNIKAASNQMEEFGKQSYLAVKRFAAFSIVTTTINSLIGAISSGFQSFIEFDRELIRLQQVTGKSQTELKNLSDTITSLAVDLGVSSEKLTQTAVTLAQAGLTAEETRVALKALAKTELAPSFDDINETTEGAIAALRQFGLQASELEGALGSINAVAAAFAVEADDLIGAIQRTGGVFAASSKGVSEGTQALNEFLAIFTSVRQTTRESAETIATGLRTIFTRIQRARTIDQLREFGIELTGLDGKFVGTYEAVKRLSEGLKSLDPRDIRFSQIVEELGGFRQIGKVIPLLQQFTVAQEALKVAQKGQSSLADAQVIAQKSLANQLAQVREQFKALIKDIGQSQAFQSLFSLVTNITSGLISLVGAFKPILPILAIIAGIKGVKAIGDFAGGFFGAMNKGSAKGVGENLGSTITGSKEREKADTTSKASDAIRENTSAIKSLTTAVASLESVIASRGGAGSAGGFNSGGKVLAFARGGVVPGTGNRDTVPAMLQPGEFVIRKKAVETLGANRLQKINKYARGGKVQKYLKGGPVSEELSALDVTDYLGGGIDPTDVANTQIVPKEINLTISDFGLMSDIMKSTEAKNQADILKFAEDPKALESAKAAGFSSVENFMQARRKLGSQWAKGNAFQQLLIQKYKVKGAATPKGFGTEEETFDNILEEHFSPLDFDDGDAKFVKNPSQYDQKIGQKELLSKRFRYEYKQGTLSPTPTDGFNDYDLPPTSIYYPADGLKEAFDRYSGTPAQAARSINPAGYFRDGGLVQKFAIGGEAQAIADRLGKGKSIADSWWTGKWNNQDILFDWASPTTAFLTDSGKEISIGSQTERRVLREKAQREWMSYKDTVRTPLPQPTPEQLAELEKLRLTPEQIEAIKQQAEQRSIAAEIARTSKITWDVEDGGKRRKTKEDYERRFTGYMAGSVVKPNTDLQRNLRERIEKLGGPKTTRELAGIPSGDAFYKKILNANSIEAGKNLDQVEQVVVKAEAQYKALDIERQAAISAANKFAVVGLLPLGYDKTFGPEEPLDSQGKKTFIIAKGLNQKYEELVRKWQFEIQDMNARQAEELQMENIFGGGGPLVFDFDKTLVDGAEILDANGNEDIPGYNDLQKVEQSLKNARLTRLGQVLQSKLSDNPELLDSIRILTARPQSNAPLLANTLSSLGLNIPEDKIKGVTGAANKIDDIGEMETLIDDRVQTIQALNKVGKKGIEYLPIQNIGGQAVQAGQAAIEGAIAESIMARLGAPLSPEASANRAIDYPQGLGAAAQYWGVPKDIPTEVKREINGDALLRARDEIARYYEETAQAFMAGGAVKLYHGTNSGPNDSVLKSFVEQGILSSLATGYGQGGGFFAWTDKASAQRQAKNIVAGNMVTQAKTGGKPMIVELTEVLDPKNWDLDYEMQAADVVNFLYKNFDRLAPLLAKSQGVDLGEGFKDFYVKEKYNEYVDPSDQQIMRKFDIGFTEEGLKGGRGLANVGGDIRTGAVIGKLIQALRIGDPSFTDPLEEEFFANLQPGQALKYVGSAPLKPSNIETFAKGGTAQDTVPALLTPGEFVINKKAAQKIGYSKLEKLNQADKLQGYNSGGAVGNVQRFFVGGVAESQTDRARGAVLKSIEEANKAFAMAVGGLGKDIRDKILSTFQGVENVRAGGRTSLGTTFTEGTRGQAAFGNKGGRDVSVMGLQIGGRKTKATTETVMHETGHLADAALGGPGEFASKTKGTFQFDLVEKVKPQMEAAFEAAGYSAKQIQKYFASNAELFAEFFAKASPEVRAIITSTTDSKEGMAKLAEHLQKVGYTYAGLEASDILGDAAANAAAQNVIPPTNVPPSGGGGGVGGGGLPPGGVGGAPPGGGIPPGGDVPPGGGATPSGGGGATGTDVDLGDLTEYFQLKADQAGQSLERFSKLLIISAKDLAGQLPKQVKAAQADFRGELISLVASVKGKGAGAIGEDATRDIVGNLSQRITSLDASISPSAAKVMAESIVAQLNTGGVGDVDTLISGLSDELKTVLTQPLGADEALNRALETIARQKGLSPELVKQFIGERAKTEGGPFERVVEYFGGPLKATTRSMVLAASALEAGAGYLEEAGLITEEWSAGAAAVVGGVRGAAEGAAVAAELDIGDQARSFGKFLEGFGGKFGTAGQALQKFSGSLQTGFIAATLVAGAIKGAANAFNQSKLEAELDKLSSASDRTTEAFKRLSSDASPANQTLARQALDVESAAAESLRSRGAVDVQGRRTIDVLRSYDFTGLAGAVSGQAQEEEARKAYLGFSARRFEQSGVLGERRLQNVDAGQIRESLDAAGAADRVIAQLAEELSQLKATGAGKPAIEAKQKQVDEAQLAKAEGLFRTSQRFGQIASTEGEQGALKEFYINQAKTEEERIRRLSVINGQSGKTEEERLQNQKRAFDEAKILAAAEAEAEGRTRLLADATHKLSVETESLLRTYTTASALLQRFGESIDLIKESANNTAAALEGQAQIGNIDRTNERVLSNIGAYSTEEVRAAAIQTGQLAGGGVAGAALQNQVMTAKVLQEALPRALETTGSEDITEVISKLETAFQTAGVEFAEPVKKQLMETLQSQVAGRQGINFDKLAAESDVVAQTLKQTDAALKTAQEFQKRYNDALQGAIELQNGYAKALQSSIEWQLEASSIRTNAAIELKEALGLRVTSQERSSNFDNRIRGLTSSNVIPGGTTDPDVILQQLLGGVAGQDTQREELARRQQAFAASPTEANKASVAQQMEAMSRQNVAINNNRKALEEMAKNTDAAAAALNNLKELDRVAEGATNFARKVLTADAEQLGDINKQLQAFTKLRTGQATGRDLNNLEFRRAAFEGGDLIKSVLPKEIGERLDAQTALQMLGSTEAGRRALQENIGGVGPQGEAMSLKALLEQRASGKIDPVQQKYIDAYTAATERQATAADKLAIAAQAVAETFNSKMLDVLSQIQQTLPTILEQSVMAGMGQGAATAWKEMNVAEKQRQGLDAAQATAMGLKPEQFNKLSQAYDISESAKRSAVQLEESQAKAAGLSVEEFRNPTTERARQAREKFVGSDQYTKAQDLVKQSRANLELVAGETGPNTLTNFEAYRAGPAYTAATANIEAKRTAFEEAQRGPQPEKPVGVLPLVQPPATNVKTLEERQAETANMDIRSGLAAGASYAATTAAGAYGFRGLRRRYKGLRDRLRGTATPAVSAADEAATKTKPTVAADEAVDTKKSRRSIDGADTTVTSKTPKPKPTPSVSVKPTKGGKGGRGRTVVNTLFTGIPAVGGYLLGGGGKSETTKAESETTKAESETIPEEISLGESSEIISLLDQIEQNTRMYGVGSEVGMPGMSSEISNEAISAAVEAATQAAVESAAQPSIEDVGPRSVSESLGLEFGTPQNAAESVLNMGFDALSLRDATRSMGVGRPPIVAGDVVDTAVKKPITLPGLDTVEAPSTTKALALAQPKPTTTQQATSLYETLGVSPTASPEEVKAAYRQKSMEFHPDRNKAADATSRMKQVNEAYEVINDPASRARYNAQIEAQTVPSVPSTTKKPMLPGSQRSNLGAGMSAFGTVVAARNFAETGDVASGAYTIGGALNTVGSLSGNRYAGAAGDTASLIGDLTRLIGGQSYDQGTLAMDSASALSNLAQVAAQTSPELIQLGSGIKNASQSALVFADDAVKAGSSVVDDIAKVATSSAASGLAKTATSVAGKALGVVTLAQGAYTGLTDTNADAANRGALERTVLGLTTGNASVGPSVTSQLIGIDQNTATNDVLSSFEAIARGATSGGSMAGIPGALAGATVAAGGEVYKQSTAAQMAIEEGLSAQMSADKVQGILAETKRAELEQTQKETGVDLVYSRGLQGISSSQSKRAEEIGIRRANIAAAQQSESIQDLQAKGVNTLGFEDLQDFINNQQAGIDQIMTQNQKEMAQVQQYGGWFSAATGAKPDTYAENVRQDVTRANRPFVNEEGSGSFFERAALEQQKLQEFKIAQSEAEARAIESQPFSELQQLPSIDDILPSEPMTLPDFQADLASIPQIDVSDIGDNIMDAFSTTTTESLVPDVADLAQDIVPSTRAAAATQQATEPRTTQYTVSRPAPVATTVPTLTGPTTVEVPKVEPIVGMEPRPDIALEKAYEAQAEANAAARPQTTPALPQPPARQAPATQQPLSPLEQQRKTRKDAADADKKARREAYLSRFRPEVREKMLTKDEKAARDAEIAAAEATTVDEGPAGRLRRLPPVKLWQVHSDEFLGPAAAQEEARRRTQAAATTNNPANQLTPEQQAQRQAFVDAASGQSDSAFALRYSNPGVREAMSPEDRARAERGDAENQLAFRTLAQQGPVPTPLQTNQTPQFAAQVAAADQGAGAAAQPGTIGLDQASLTAITSLTSSFESFGKYVTQLSQIKLPEKIEIVGNANYKMDINISGAAALQMLEEKTKELGQTLIVDRINELERKLNIAFPEQFKPSGTGGKSSASSNKSANTG